MARLWTGGAESGDDTTEGLDVADVGTHTYDTGVKRSGTRSHKCDSGAGNGEVLRTFIYSFVSGRWYYLRVHMYIPSATGYPSTTAQIISAGYPVHLHTDGTIGLYWGGSQIGSSSAVLSTDTWHRIEIGWSINTALGSDDSAELRLNGVTVASETNVNRTAGLGGGTGFGWRSKPGANKVVYFDDCAVNDDQGSEENSWPGPGEVFLCLPVSDNARAGWTAGAAGTTNLFAAVDNTPPVGVANGSISITSQIRNSTGTSGQNYDANCQTPTVAGVAAGKVVRVAQGIWVVGASGGNRNGSLETVTPAIASTGSFNWNTGASVSTHPTNWQRHAGTVAYNPTLALGTTPVIRWTNLSTNANNLHSDFGALLIEVEDDTRPSCRAWILE